MSGYIGPQPVPQATQHREAFTATASQTSFATAGYTPQFIDVYLNGIKLAPADYTATNGSDVVLTTGAAASDILEYVAYTPFEVANQTFTGTTTLTDSGSAPLFVNRTTSDGDITTFQKDGTTVGGIGSKAASGVSKLTIGTGNAGLWFTDSLNSIIPVNVTTNATTDGTLDIGYSTNRFRSAYLSGGVYLGGTVAANKLDDYEEGTWTPTVSGVTLSSSDGSYTKVGRTVTAHFNITANATTSTGGFRMGSLPFTPDDATSFGVGSSAGYLGFSTDVTYSYTLLFDATATSVEWRRNPGGATDNITSVSGNQYVGTLVYYTV